MSVPKRSARGGLGSTTPRGDDKSARSRHAAPTKGLQPTTGGGRKPLRPVKDSTLNIVRVPSGGQTGAPSPFTAKFPSLSRVSKLRARRLNEPEPERQLAGKQPSSTVVRVDAANSPEAKDAAATVEETVVVDEHLEVDSVTAAEGRQMMELALQNLAARRIQVWVRNLLRRWQHGRRLALRKHLGAAKLQALWRAYQVRVWFKANHVRLLQERAAETLYRRTVLSTKQAVWRAWRQFVERRRQWERKMREKELFFGAESWKHLGMKINRAAVLSEHGPYGLAVAHWQLRTRATILLAWMQMMGDRSSPFDDCRFELSPATNSTL